GRILRITESNNQEAWLYTFAEESLMKFSERIEQDIPESCLYVMQKNVNEEMLNQTPPNDLSLPSSTIRSDGEMYWNSD
ncbi:diguanylate cyclase, partial [Vibrio sp. Vb2880]|nr:diguanylate cyclase [Vibrio sp. Vb2880]